MTTRRGLLLGLGASLITAPAIVRAASLMPVRSFAPSITSVDIVSGGSGYANYVSAVCSRYPGAYVVCEVWNEAIDFTAYEWAPMDAQALGAACSALIRDLPPDYQPRLADPRDIERLQREADARGEIVFYD